jgi:acetylornithine deacetylase/succinyl-diaminopimelate desuccinylase-like protein
MSTEAHAPRYAPAELLQHLIRFDTTNPPGSEAACVEWISGVLAEAGIESTLVSRDPARPNLVARLPGRGEAPPLLLYGHVDVVTTEGQSWTHPPFEGREVDGWVWGRGALDMKGGVAMMLHAFLRAKAEGLAPAGDLVFCVLSDEEAGGDYGARFLAEEHPELFAGVRWAIGEFGGFTIDIAGQRFYAIQVAEKQICWLRATIHGRGGHGSLPISGGAVAKLGEFLSRLVSARLPVHVTPPLRAMVEGIAAALPEQKAQVIRGLLSPDTAEQALAALGEQAALFQPLLHNTAGPTIVRAGSKINVAPAEAVVEMDGRLLPGQRPEDLLAELRPLLPEGAELEVVRYDPGPPEPDLGWMDGLSDVLREADPGCVPVPLIIFGATDARWLSRLGIQTYGFLPMNLPADFPFLRTIHAADERISVSAMEFGADCIFRAIRRQPS